MAKGKKNAGGRPSGYDPKHHPFEAERICLLGATDEVLAEHLGIAVSTLYEWKLQFPEFSEAIKRGKRPADADVASSLHRRAVGIEYDKQVPMKVKDIEYDERGKKVRETERVELVAVREVIPPDTTACIFWLTNRAKDHWRHRVTSVAPPGAPLTADQNGPQPVAPPESREQQLESKVLKFLRTAKERREAAKKVGNG